MDLIEVVVSIKRVAKVVEGGRCFSFSVCVVVGDKSGSVGCGHGKASEVMDAKAKALQNAKKNIVKVPLYSKRTIHHDITFKKGASKVIIRKAPPGTGVIAGGAMRAVFNCLGVKDVVSKSIGSSNPNMLVVATIEALRDISTPRFICKKRNKAVEDIFPKTINSTRG